MTRLNAISFTQDVKDWLTNTRQPRVLHIFDNACNLINEQKDVLSLVTSQIGNGPFNLVLEKQVLFSEYFDVRSEIAIQVGQLILGDLSINTVDAKLWSPRPDWEGLYAKRADILNRILSLQTDDEERSNPEFLASLVSANISDGTKLVSRLAGLGQGLTPAGDDFIMGALYATWIIHPLEVSSKLAKEVAEAAAPLTTSLSAAWIRSVGMGEAGEAWHDLFDSLVSSDNLRIQESVDNILGIGETSGADALAGFIEVCSAAKEHMYN